MLKIKDFVLNNEDLFGYYCYIEQKCYIGKNEQHIYKVIGRFRSNVYADVPVDARNFQPYRHEEIVDVVNVIHCGVCEDKVLRYRFEDIKLIEKGQI